MPDVTITSSSAIAVPEKANRRALLIQNRDPSAAVFVQFGKAVATSGSSSGYKLPPDTDGKGGGVLSVNSDANNGAAAVAVYAIVASGTATLNYIEVTEDDLPS